MPTGKIHPMHNATKTLLLISLSATTLVASGVARATCWNAASESYGIPVDVIKAVAKTESGFNADALNVNKYGSHDIGVMQINSFWLPALAKHGIDEEALKDPCTNVKVGAWILANNAKRLGWNWNAIGAYNVGCAKLSAEECDRRRSKYAWKIHAALNQVTDIKSPAPQKPIPSYEQATSTSKTIVRGPEDSTAKKIFVVRMESSQPPMQVATADLEANVRGLSVGGFLNYEEAESDE